MNNTVFKKYDCFKCIKCSTILIIRSNGLNNTKCGNCNYITNVIEVTDKNRIESSKHFIKYTLIKEEPDINDELTKIDENIKINLSKEKQLNIEHQQLVTKKAVIQQNLQLLYQNRNALLNKYEQLENSKYKSTVVSSEDQLELKKKFNYLNHEPQSPEVKTVNSVKTTNSVKIKKVIKKEKKLN